mmetsp:Transcript_40788/g.91203  ORF Transcript_40788/g.91203 Transcript_40788/m.91203 type:complete len:220 (+) Transcript_40788:80-739(+)
MNAGSSSQSPKARQIPSPIGGPAPSPSAAAQPKLPLRPAGVAIERAPPPWLVGAGKEDDARSDADSVVSEYRDESEQATQSPTSLEVSSNSDHALHDGKKTKEASQERKRKQKELELPMVAGAEGRPRPSSGSSAREPASPPAKSAMQQDLSVSASTAGEWVNRLQALKDVSDEHASCARRMLVHVEDMFSEVRALSSDAKSNILEQIFTELELSRGFF